MENRSTMLPATTASVTCLTVLLLAACSTGAKLDVFLFARRQNTCFADPLSSRIGDRALCPFTRTVDLQAGRIPAAIPTVRCNCPGSRCSQINDFRCQEVREVLQVAYTENAGPTTFRNETFTVACACITSKTGRAVSDRLTRVEDHPSSPYGNRMRNFRWKYAVRQLNRLQGLVSTPPTAAPQHAPGEQE